MGSSGLSLPATVLAELRIVLSAEESAGLRVLRAIHSSEQTIVAVLAERADTGRESVATAAVRLGLPVLPPRLVEDPSFAETLSRERVDLLLNVHSLHLVAAQVLAAPAIGSFNLHPGPLPDYAGLDAPSWAVYNAEPSYGCTLHWMAAEVDAGPIAYSATFATDPLETAISLYLKCVRHGVPLVTELIGAAAAGGRAAIPALAQDRAKRRTFARLPPHGGWLPWELEAERLAALVRACDYGPFESPWGSARTSAGEVEVEVLRATVGPAHAGETPGTIGAHVDGGVLVAAADRWLLIEAVRVDGRMLEPAAVLRPGARCTPVEP